MDRRDSDQATTGIQPGRMAKFAAASLAIVVLFYLLREHWGHALGALPYVLLLACPLLHLFHGQGGDGHGHRGQDRQRP